MKPCPYCAEPIQDAAAKCRFCGEWIDPSKRPAWSEQPGPIAPPSMGSWHPQGHPPGVPVPHGGMVPTAHPSSFAESAVPVASTPQSPASPPAAQLQTAEAVPVQEIAEPAPAVVAAPRPERPRAARPVDTAAPQAPLEPVMEQPYAGRETAPSHPGPEPNEETSGAQTWEAPAWLAETPPRTPDAPGWRAADHTVVDGSSAGTALRATPHANSGAPAQTGPAPPTTADPGAASLEEVALRMQRIKASAAAVRQAIVAEASRHKEQLHVTPDPRDVRTELAAAQVEPRIHEPPPPPPRATEPSPSPVPGPSSRSVEPPPRMPETAPVMHGRRAASAPRGPAGLERFDELDDAGENQPEDRAPPRSGAPRGFEAAFLGDDLDEDDEDDHDDADAFGSMEAPRPVPWGPIVGAAAVLVAIGAYFVADAMLEPETATPTEASAEAEDVDTQPAVAEAPPKPPEPVAETPEPGAGQPVTPEPPADTPPPAVTPVSPDVMAKIEEARALYQAGGRKKLAEARSILDEVLKAHPSQSDALLLMAQVLLEQGEGDASLETATKCTQVAADNAICWLTIGVLKQDKKQYEEAARAYEKYLALAPDGQYAGDVRKQLERLN